MKSKAHDPKEHNEEAQLVAGAVMDIAKYAASLPLNTRQRSLALAVASGNELAFSVSGQMGEALAGLSNAYDEMMGILYSLQMITGDDILLGEMIHLTADLSGKSEAAVYAHVKETKAVLSGVKAKLNPDGPDALKTVGPAN